MADWPDDGDEQVFEQLDGSDTLDDRAPEDPLDSAYSPPEKPWGVEGFGLTASEVAEGESLGARLARELPDTALDDDSDGIGDTVGTDGEPYDGEVGAGRSGRLVATDEGDLRNTEEELYASDVGIDGAAASAEEAAVHLIEERAED